MKEIRTSRVGCLTFSSESNCELDSHADTYVLGKHAHIFMDHERSVDIVGYDKSKWTFGSNIKTVSGALAYDNPTSGTTVIIVVDQAIHVPTMDCNLICPMQVRMNDVKLDDKPKFLTEDPTDESHAISCEDNTATLVNISLSLKGVTSYFPTRKPTKHEFENCPRIELTYLTHDWDPHSATFQEQEQALMDNKGKLHEWNNKRMSVDT